MYLRMPTDTASRPPLRGRFRFRPQTQTSPRLLFRGLVRLGYRAVASHTARGRVSPRWHESVSVHSTPVAANPPRACAMWRGGGARLQLAFSGREGPKPRMAPTPEHAGSEPRRQYHALCVPADGRSPSTCARRQPPRPPAGQFAGRFPGRQHALPSV